MSAPERAARQPQASRSVSRPHDHHELEARRAADAISTGASVTSWSFSSLDTSVRAPVQREDIKQQTPEKEQQDATDKIGEAVLETPLVKALKEKVLAHPYVTALKEWITSPTGMAILLPVGARAAEKGLGELIEKKMPLPAQIGEISLDSLVPGMSVTPIWEGPVGQPTSGSLSVKFAEQPTGPKRPPDAPVDAALENARRASEFRAGTTVRPGSKPAPAPTPQQQADASMSRQIAAQVGILPDVGRLLMPLTGSGPVRRVPQERAQPKREEEKPAMQPSRPASYPQLASTCDDAGGDGAEREARHVGARVGEGGSVAGHTYAAAPGTPQRDDAGRASAGRTGSAGDHVDAAIASSSRPIDPSMRRHMETRFAHDFSGVRLHSDRTAAGSAAALDARAYAVGEHIVLGPGSPSLATREGQRLLAHELTHVVQQRGTAHRGSGGGKR